MLWGDNTDVSGSWPISTTTLGTGWEQDVEHRPRDRRRRRRAGRGGRASRTGPRSASSWRTAPLAKAEDLVRDLDAPGSGGRRCETSAWEALGAGGRRMPGSSSTPRRSAWRASRPLALDLAGAPRDAVVADIVYVPLKTPLLAAAAAQGLRTVDGLGMLLHQAVPGFQRWFGVTPEVTPELRALILADIEAPAMTFVLGLTGSIGMGKSATADLFRRLGVPVHDADATVHGLYRGRAAPLIEKAFPGTVADGAVDRAKLGAAVLDDPDALKQLEAIVHPLVREEEEAFLKRVSAGWRPVAVLDIPLLFETGGETRCDAVLVVTAPAAVQRERVLARPGMTEEQFHAILAKQMPDAEKRRRAHFLVDTGRGFASAESPGAVHSCLSRRPVRDGVDAIVMKS